MTRKARSLVLAVVLLVALCAPSFGPVLAAGPTIGPGLTGYRYYVSDIDGSYQPYGMYVPTSYNSSTPVGVAFYLHGFGGSTNLSFSAVRRSWADANGVILVNLHGRMSQNWDLVGDEDLFGVLADLKGAYNIDEDRIYVEGTSMGGHGSYRWAFRYPDLFAAAAPVAGWTTYEAFYFHWYAGLNEDVGNWGYANGNRPPILDAAQYADPARRPLLETASPRYQAENGKYVWLWMGSSTGDNVNYPHNAQWVKDAFDRFGYTNYVWHQVAGGHGSSRNENLMYPGFFDRKTRVENPPSPVYTTNTLKYNRAYWLQIDRLQYANAWARLAANVVAPNRIEVQADNIVQYTLSLNSAPIDRSQTLQILTNGVLSYEGPASDSITIYATLSPANAIVGWSDGNTLPGGLRKTKALSGPIGDAFSSKFVVVYGTSGTPEQTAQNKADAEQFVREWNAYMIQSNAAWGFPGPQRYLSAIPDTAVTPEMIATSNLRLFGDHNTNSITAQIKDGLPLAFQDNGIKVGDRTYSGDHVRYTVIYPNPLNPDKYVVAGRGYLSETNIPGTTLGKNLERLPWGEPDYVVWDASRTPGPTVQNPNGTIFRHLPDMYLEAGFFDQNWQLDTTAPVTTFESEIIEQDGTPAVKVTLSAADNLGGFGVAKTEYRVDDGEWTVYTGPFTLAGPNMHTVEYRSTDAAGRDVSPQGIVPANVEAVKTAQVSADTLPPAVTVSFPSPAEGQDGWFNAQDSVVGTVTADDTETGGSNITAITADGATLGEIAGLGTPSASAPLTVDVEGITAVSATATDGAGNTGVGNVVTVKVDKTAPTITVTAPVEGEYLLNQVVVADYGASDSLSGLASLVGTVPSGSAIDTASAGVKTFTVEARDVAGNVSSQTVTYRVAFGVHALYDQTKVHKSGSTVPIKIQLTDAGGVNVSDVAVTIHATGLTRLGEADGQVPEAAGNANPDGAFRYDPELQGYIYNLRTKDLEAGTWQLWFTVAGDPVTHSVQLVVR